MKNKVYTFFVLLVLSATKLLAQGGTTSPYSRYGIGDFQNNGSIENFMLGASGAALQTDTMTPFYINSGNPAAYPYIRLTTFSAALRSNTLQLFTNNSNQTTNASSLGYLAFAFPVKKWWGTGFGLQPLTSVGYNVIDKQQLDSVGDVKYVYNGTGGINKIYWANGFKVGGFSFGATASYLFGRIDNTRRVVLPSTSGTSTKVENTTLINDAFFEYGAQYAFTIDSVKGRELRDDVRFIAGLTFSTGTNIGVRTSSLARSYLVDGFGLERIRDTIENTKELSNTIKLPFMLTGGLTFRKGDNLMIGAEFNIQNWEEFTLLGVNGGLKNTNRISVFTEYLPARKSDITANYFQKIYYRAGLRYATSPVYVKNTQLTEYGISVGLGLPVGFNRHNFQYNFLNIGFEYGERGTTNNNLLKERFFNVMIGITINDRWFIKPKFD